MKLTLTALIALALAGSALASPSNRTLTIRHQVHHCHSWSFDGTTWRASQSATLAAGSTLTVVDNDVMSHTLVQVSGPKATITGAAMKTMSAHARVVLELEEDEPILVRPLSVGPLDLDGFARRLRPA